MSDDEAQRLTRAQGNARTERAYPRVAIDAFVRVVGADREYAFRTRDLSEGGLFLHTRVGHLYPLPVGADVAIELHWAGPAGPSASEQDAIDQVLTLRGVVVRIVELDSAEAAKLPAGFGVRLNPLPPRERSILLDIIRAAGEAAR